MVKRLLVALVACSIISGAAAAQSQQGEPQGQPVIRLRTVAPTKDGWWIRVNPATTDATGIEWQFGTTPKDLTEKDSWQPSGPVETYLAPAVRTEKVIHIRATTTPANASASFCVFWQQQAVALVKFTGTTDRQLDANMRESQCGAPLIYRIEAPGRDILPPPKNPIG